MKSWENDEGLGAKISPSGNFTAKRLHGPNRVTWELLNHLTGETTYHDTFKDCKELVEEFEKEKG